MTTSPSASRSSSTRWRVYARPAPGLRSNEWIDGGEHDGVTLFFHACQLGLEGIVSKRKELLRA